MSEHLPEFPIFLDEIPKKSEQVKIIIPAAAARAPKLEKKDSGLRPEEALITVDGAISWEAIFTTSFTAHDLVGVSEWGHLSDSIKELLPSSQWSLVWLGDSFVSLTLLEKFSDMLLKFISLNSREIPTEVTLTVNSTQGKSFFTLEWQKGELPPLLIPQFTGWSILPVMNATHYCYRISYIGPQYSTKVGSA